MAILYGLVPWWLEEQRCWQSLAPSREKPDNGEVVGDVITINLQIQTNVITSAFNHKTLKLLFLGSSCIYPKFDPQPKPKKSTATECERVQCSLSSLCPNPGLGYQKMLRSSGTSEFIHPRDRVSVGKYPNPRVPDPSQALSARVRRSPVELDLENVAEYLSSDEFMIQLKQRRNEGGRSAFGPVGRKIIKCTSCM